MSNTAIPGANSVADVLRNRYGFEVKALRDASRAEALKALMEVMSLQNSPLLAESYANRCCRPFSGDLSGSKSLPTGMRGGDWSFFLVILDGFADGI